MVHHEDWNCCAKCTYEINSFCCLLKKFLNEIWCDIKRSPSAKSLVKAIVAAVFQDFPVERKIQTVAWQLVVIWAISDTCTLLAFVYTRYSSCVSSFDVSISGSVAERFYFHHLKANLRLRRLESPDRSTSL